MDKDFSFSPPLGIRAYSDFYDHPERKVWGDYWLKENLTREFVRSGYPIDHESPKVVLHLFGEPLADLTEDTYNILWIHSHPDWISREVLKKYRKIYCISEPFTRKIIRMGFEADFLMVPTNMTPVFCEKKYDIVFVGNARQNKTRKVIRDLGESPHQVKIWGWGWKDLVPSAWYGGDYYENAGLNELYASSRIVLNDHHDDMRREGFINPRIFDVLASGGFVVSDDLPGMNDLLDNSVPTYRTPEELRKLLNTYIRADTERERLAGRGREIASRFTYAACCREIIRHISTVSGTLFP